MQMFTSYYSTASAFNIPSSSLFTNPIFRAISLLGYQLLPHITKQIHFQYSGHGSLNETVYCLSVAALQSSRDPGYLPDLLRTFLNWRSELMAMFKGVKQQLQQVSVQIMKKRAPLLGK
jgi:hypothetical protein